MSFLGYLIFKGNSKEVIEYYIDKLEVATKNIITFREVVEEDVKDKYEDDLDLIANGVLETDYGTLYLSDAPSMMQEALDDKKIIQINVEQSNVNKLKNIFNLLAQEGQIINPFSGYNNASLVDKFGVTWNFQ